MAVLAKLTGPGYYMGAREYTARITRCGRQVPTWSGGTREALKFQHHGDEREIEEN